MHQTIYDLEPRRGKPFKVLGTSSNTQIATMTLGRGENSGPPERHPGDQITLVLKGRAIVVVGRDRHEVLEGQLIQVPPRTLHQIRNDGAEDLFVLNIYAPPAYGPTGTPKKVQPRKRAIR